MRRRCLIALRTALALLAPMIAAGAQPSREFSVRADNDQFNFWLAPWERSDDQYTSGVRIAYDNAWVPWWRGHLWGREPRCDRTAAACVLPRVVLGQDIYNPARGTHQRQLRDSRPNAGWLFYSETLDHIRDGGRTRDAAQLTLGVTGPPSLGEAMQEFAHARAPRINRPIDWSQQIQFEPGVIAQVERQSLFTGNAGPFGAQLLPALSLSAGNVLTEAAASLGLRTGLSLDHPWLAARMHGGRELAFSADVRGRAVAHDLFLDGNTFRQSPRVAREPFVLEQHAGVSLRIGWLHAAYDAQWSTATYRGGPPHIWSAMTGGVVFTR